MTIRRLPAPCGTERGYRRHVRDNEPTCPDCRAAHSIAVKRRLHNPSWIDATEARDHVARLMAHGVTLAAIATRAGVSEDTVWKLRSGRPRIHADTAAAILGVNPDPTPTALVDASGTHRRIRALMALGWRHQDITADSGVASSVLLHTRAKVTVTNAQRIAATYDRLSLTPGPSRATANRAKALGYAPPLAWDDDAIDDPFAEPQMPAEDRDGIDPVVVERLAAGGAWKALGATRPERLAAAEVMLRRGAAVADVERHLTLRGGRDFQRPGRVAA